MGRVPDVVLIALLVAGCAAPTPAPGPGSPPPAVPPAAVPPTEAPAVPPAVAPETPSAVAPATPPAVPPETPPVAIAPVTPPVAAAPTPVEWAPRKKRPESGILATTGYVSCEEEKPFLEKVPGAERTTGTMFADYSIAGKTGVTVGWFGIVHGVREDAAAGTTRLLVEQKYFDGLQDSHILCTSFHGAGDFVATLRGTGHGIPILSMVKVYGTVASEKDGLPRLPADFVRVFSWGTFTFMGDYGKPKGNGKWRERNTVAGDRLYSPSPGESYYRARLGDPAVSAEVPE